jgi:ribonucleoside-diphosphate reductase alpha chain
MLYNVISAIQPYVDSAISRTINIPQVYSAASFRSLYMVDFELGLKSWITFRPNPVTSSVLSGGEGGHCCNIDREAD